MSVEQDVSWETLKLQPDFKVAVDLVATTLTGFFVSEEPGVYEQAAEGVLEAIWRVET